MSASLIRSFSHFLDKVIDYLANNLNHFSLPLFLIAIKLLLVVRRFRWWCVALDCVESPNLTKWSTSIKTHSFIWKVFKAEDTA